MAEFQSTIGQNPSAQRSDTPVLDLHELYERQAELRPDAIAVTGNGKHLSFSELNRRAEVLSQQLTAIGLQTESLVGICMDVSVELLIGILAVLKAGGTYVPVDPRLAGNRFEFILKETNLSIVITNRKTAPSLPPGHVKYLVIDSDEECKVQILPKRDRRAGGMLDQLAYVMYTSGSTGKPKGVMIARRGIVNLLEWMVRTLSLSESDKILCCHSHQFDITTPDMFLPGMCGASLLLSPVILDKGEPAAQQRGATLISATPSMWQVLLAHNPGMTVEKGIVGGEPASASTIGQLRVAVRTLWHMYGPTEATVWATGTDQLSAQISIGKPIDNVEIYLLDENLKQTSFGQIGELYIGGVGLAKGYFGRPDLTAERFISNPFGEKGSRLYRTGDLCRFLADGNLEFLGRIDEQVKIRGYRIEPGEIEHVLSRQPRIKQAAVVAHGDSRGEKHLVGYVVVESEDSSHNTVTAEDASASSLHGDQETLTSWLLRVLGEQLPNYMVPSTIIELDSLPLTPNGKIDRRGLPAPDWSRNSEEGYIEARNDVEKQLSRIWSAVLRVDRIGVEDNFFDLGGDSLLATQMTARANQMGIGISQQAIFQRQTISGLADAQMQAVMAEIPFWLEQTSEQMVPLLEDFTDGENTTEVAEEVSISLGEAETEKLLVQAPSAYNTQINDILLTALAKALQEWLGSGGTAITLEGHGREDIDATVDTTRTLGWFTTLFPIYLSVPPAADVGTSLKFIKEQLRRIPGKGIGYGLLRYLHPDPEVRARLQDQPQPQISFNYLGRFDQMLPANSALVQAAIPVGAAHSPRARRAHLIDINGMVQDGHLSLHWTYSTKLHQRATIESLASRYLHHLKELIAHCTTPGVGELISSDFSDAGLSQDDLAKVLGSD